MTNQQHSRRKRILIVGHPCSPVQGSEPGSTWNWAWHLSEHFDVHVLCHPVYKGEVETYLAQRPNSHLNFTWVTVPAAIDPWRDFTRRRGLKIHYALYQNRALSVARALVRAGSIDLIHHVSWGTVSYPPALWKLDVPFVWGPVGGGQTAPSCLSEFLGSAWPAERIRNLRVAASASFQRCEARPPVRVSSWRQISRRSVCCARREPTRYVPSSTAGCRQNSFQSSPAR